MTGGIINQYLESWGNGSVTVSGGFIGLTILVGYKNSSTWPVYDTSTLTLIGSDFRIDGNPLENGRYYMTDFSSGHITGILQNGDSLDNDFEIWDGASLIIIPEPYTFSLLALGAMLAGRKKRMVYLTERIITL